MKSRIWFALLVCIFASLVTTYAQLSLDDMIDKIKHDNGLVFNPVGPPQPPIPPQHNAHLIHAATVSHDTRYDPRVSNFVSSRILQIAHNISLQYRDVPVKNSILAPVSIAGALALLLLGANGQTFQELLHVCGFDQDPDVYQYPFRIHEEFGLLIEDLLSDIQNPARPRPLHPWKYMSKGQSSRRQYNDSLSSPSQNHFISVANAIFTQRGYSLRPTYQAAVQDIYRSEIIPLDFRGNLNEAKQYINDWVKYKTRGKIEQIVGAEVDSNTNMVIASTLYFKALWEQTFIDGATNRKNFYPNGLGTEPITVDMMAHGGEFPFYDAKEYDCRILGFPYRGNQTTMYIILPNNSSRQRLREIQTFLTPDKIEDLISKMQLKTAIILFPKLHIQNSINLKTVFMNMGLHTLFDPVKSDLSLISSGLVQTFNNLKNPASGFVRPETPPMNPNIPVFQPEYIPNAPIASNSFAPVVSNGHRPDRVSGLQNELIFSRFGSDDEDETKDMQADQAAPPEETTTKVETTTEKEAETKEPVAESADRKKRAVTYKVESGYRKESPPLRYKDFVLSKRIVKQKTEKKLARSRRQVIDPSNSIKQLDFIRNTPSLRNPGIFADAIVHKIDLTINEQGTEGGAATAVYLTRTGTDVVFRVETPFLLLVRHDATKLPLFYGSVYEPTN